MPVERFRYDAKHDLVRRPRKEILTPRLTTKTGHQNRAMVPGRCLSGLPFAGAMSPRCRAKPQGPDKQNHIRKTHVAVLPARRKRQAWGQRENRLYARHRWRVEGAHGLAKTLDGMSRATRRGLEHMKIQALLTATAINLKRLAWAILLAVIHALVPAKNQPAIPP